MLGSHGFRPTYLLVLGVATLTACVTPSEKRQMRNEMFALQTRLMTIESAMAEGKQETASTGELQKRKLATTSTELERMQSELLRVRGEIDALKIGVTTGQMPGQEASANSIATQLKDLSDRLAAVEGQQAELATAIERNAKRGAAAAKPVKGDKAAEAKANSGKRLAMTTVEQLSEAFEKRRYKHVTEDAPQVLKAAKGKDKEEVSFMYAESLFRVGRLRESALQFNDFMEGKPSAKHMPVAKMRMGDSFRHMGDAATAKIYYEELIAKFPQSPEAEKAKERLAELAAGGGAKPAATKGSSQGSAVRGKSAESRVAQGSSATPNPKTR